MMIAVIHYTKRAMVNGLKHLGTCQQPNCQSHVSRHIGRYVKGSLPDVADCFGPKKSGSKWTQAFKFQWRIKTPKKPFKLFQPQTSYNIYHHCFQTLFKQLPSDILHAQWLPPSGYHGSTVTPGWRTQCWCPQWPLRPCGRWTEDRGPSAMLRLSSCCLLFGGFLLTSYGWSWKETNNNWKQTTQAIKQTNKLNKQWQTITNKP